MKTMTLQNPASAVKDLPEEWREAARARGLVVKEELKRAEGGSLSAEETARLLGLSKEAVLKRYHKGQLPGWREAKQNAVRFPAWQFQDGQLLPGMREVLAVLARGDHVNDWGRILFFESPSFPE